MDGWKEQGKEERLRMTFTHAHFVNFVCSFFRSFLLLVSTNSSLTNHRLAGDRLVEKLRGFADHESAEIVAQIASEEVGHVAVGVKWFKFICEKQRVDPKVRREPKAKRDAISVYKSPFSSSSP